MTLEFDAVIFDMDGLLLDTERVAFQTFVQTCLTFGIDVDRNTYARCIGTSGARTRDILAEVLAGKVTYEELHAAWLERYDAVWIRDEALLKPGATSLLQRLADARVPRGLATSTGRARAIRKLTKAGLLPLLTVVVCGDDVTAGKPDPEIYLTAAERLGVEPRRVVAVEDSDHGVRAARAAGMVVIQVPDFLPPSDETRAFGHIIVASLDDVARLLIAPLPTQTAR